MLLPHKIATLLYCFNANDEVLLMERAQEPNLGLWSPPGGKLKPETGESPHACAIREAREELGVALDVSETRLTGIISEHGYDSNAHWLMFLFEVTRKIESTPPPIREGVFQFFKREQLDTLDLPQTDREKIWPLFWEHRGGFFAAHCHCHENRGNEWTVEQSSNRQLP